MLTVSSHDEFMIGVLLDTNEAEAQLNILQTKLDTFAREEAEMIKKFDRAVIGMMNTMRGLTALFRSTLAYFGLTLDPIQDAILMSIQTSLTAALAIHRTLEASTLGISGAVTIGLSMLAITMSVAAIGQASSGMADAKAQTDRAIGIMAQVESIISTSQIWM